MEHADGGTFRTWLQEHRDDQQARQTQGLDYFKQICRGVMACHAVDITHLDLKPENSLFVGGNPKVADFNVYALVQNLTCTRTSARAGNNEDWCLGTPAYMSPEHYTAPHRDDLDPRADVYSLGVMLFEILHPKARPPFGGNPQRLCRMHLEVQSPPLTEANETEARVVERCLKKNPAQRYQSVKDLLDDLDGLLVSDSEDPENGNSQAEQLNAMWQQALRAFSEDRLTDAQGLCRQLLQEYPNHADAQDCLEEIQQRYDRATGFYSEIERGFETLGLTELSAFLVEAVNLYPDHPNGHTIQVRLQAKARKYRKWMEESMIAIRHCDWEEAKSCLEKARQLNPGATEAERPVHFAEKVLQHVQEVRGWIDNAIAARNKERAMALARSIDEYLDSMAQKIGLPEQGTHT